MPDIVRAPSSAEEHGRDGPDPHGVTRTRFLRRLSGFIGLPLLSSLAPMALLPVLSRVSAVPEWGGIGVGQGLGSLASAFIICGWTLTGPAVVARADEQRRRALYSDSLVSRLLVLAIASPAFLVVAAFLAPRGGGVIAALTAFAFSLGGLSPAWFAIGKGTPLVIARYEVLPKTIASVLAIPVLLLTGWVPAYPLLIVGSTAVGIIAYSARNVEAAAFSRTGLRHGVRTVYRMRSATATVVVAAFYSTTPVAIMGGLLTAPALASYTSADRIYRIGLYFVVAIGNAFQGWVAEHRSGQGSGSRMAASLWTHAALGLVGFGVLAGLGPFLSRAVFGTALEADAWTCFWYGIAFFGVAMTTSLGFHILVPSGRQRCVLHSTMAGAGVGVTAMILLGHGGASGGAAGLAIGETVVLLVQVIAVARNRARLWSSTPMTEVSPAQV